MFEGDLIVTQRAPQLYAQSLRGGSSQEDPSTEPGGKTEESNAASESNLSVSKTEGQLPLWLLGTVGGSVIGASAFLAGSFWSSRRHRSRTETEEDKETSYETKIHLNNHHHQPPTLPHLTDSEGEREEIQKSN